MNEKNNTDEILEDLLPELEFPELELPELEEILLSEEADALIDAITAEAEEDALINAITAEVTEESLLSEDADEKMEFDLDAFLPEDPDEIDGTEVDVAELELSSGYMDNYPVLPDTVEEPTAEPENPTFDDGGEFDVQFNRKTDSRKAAPANRDRHTRKGRPRRRKGAGLLGIPHMLATVVWLLLILAIGVSMGRFLWVCASDVLAFGRE